MPRTKIGRNPAQHIVANIAYFEKLYGYDRKKHAVAMRVSENTVTNRKRNPENFTIGELQRLAASFHCSISDLLEGGTKHETS